MFESLGINGWNLIVQIIAFIIFLWLLWRFALGPITRVIDERQARIQESMQAAERMKAELAATAARNEEVLAEARQQAQQIVAQAREAGEATLSRAREQANAQAEEYLARAEATCGYEALGKATWTKEFTSTADGMQINEVAIYNDATAGDALMRHKYSSTKALDNTESLTISIVYTQERKAVV